MPQASCLNSFMTEAPTYRNQPIDLQSDWTGWQSMDWILHDGVHRYETERVKAVAGKFWPLNYSSVLLNIWEVNLTKI